MVNLKIKAKTIIFNERDIFKILKGSKNKTARGLNIDLEVGEVVKFAILYRPPFALAKIVNKQFIEDISQLKASEFKALGYKTKKDYLNEPFNLNKPSKARFIYEFEIIEYDLKPYIESFNKKNE